MQDIKINIASDATNAITNLNNLEKAIGNTKDALVGLSPALRVMSTHEKATDNYAKAWIGLKNTIHATSNAMIAAWNSTKDEKNELKGLESAISYLDGVVKKLRSNMNLDEALEIEKAMTDAIAQRTAWLNKQNELEQNRKAAKQAELDLEQRITEAIKLRDSYYNGSYHNLDISSAVNDKYLSLVGTEPEKLNAKIQELDSQLRKYIADSLKAGDAGGAFDSRINSTKNDLQKAKDALSAYNQSIEANRKAQHNAKKELDDSIKKYQSFIDVWNRAKEINAKNKSDEMFLNLTGSDIDKASAKVKQLEQNLKLYCDQAVKGKGNQEALKNSIAKTNIELQNAKKELEKLTKTSALTAWSTKLLSILKNIMGFQLILGTVRRALSFVTNTISDSTRVAAEAEQVYSKLNTVFEGLPDSMGKVKELSSQMGMATSTTANALSTVADLLQAQGMGVAQSFETASEWVKKFQDIIAFKDVNMSLEEFAQNFMSGAAGNLRNFRTFGSIVKEGDVKSILGENASDLEKVLTRANLAYEQQANAVGAVKREWDSVLSVNTRLSESWKQWKTNLGGLLNNVLHPIKKTITEIIEDMNKASKKSENDKNNIITYTEPNDPTRKSKDYKALRKQLEEFVKDNDYGLGGVENLKNVLKSFAELDISTMGAVAIDVFGQADEDAMKLYETLKATKDIVQEERHEKTVIDFWATEALKAKENVEAYVEALKEVKGINLNGFSYSDTGEISVRELNNKNEAGKTAIGEMLNSGLYDYIDKTDILFNQTSAIQDGYKEWLKNLRLAYEVIDDIEGREELIAKYKQVQEFSEAYNTSLGTFTSTSDFDSQYSSLKKTLQGLQLQSIQMESPYDAMLEELKQMRESALNIEGLTEEQVLTLSNTMSAIESERINIYNRQESQSMKDTAYGSLGEVGTLIQGIQKMMSGGGIGGLWSFIFKIASQLTIVQKIGSFFTDHLLPKLNALLEPLEPVLEGIGLMFEAMLDALKPLFPLLKMIAKLFIYVGGAIYSCVQFIVDAVNWLLNKISFGWLGNDSNPVANWNDNWATINRLIADIDSKTGEIADNTSTDDSYMKAYQELFSKGLISGQQYASYMGSHYGYNTATALASGGSYANSNGVYVERQNAVFNISGVDMDRTTLIELIKSALNGTGSFSNSVAWA